MKRILVLLLFSGFLAPAYAQEKEGETAEQRKKAPLRLCLRGQRHPLWRVDLPSAQARGRIFENRKNRFHLASNARSSNRRERPHG